MKFTDSDEYAAGDLLKQQGQKRSGPWIVFQSSTKAELARTDSFVHTLEFGLFSRTSLIGT